jgi:hypothetical protein
MIIAIVRISRNLPSSPCFVLVPRPYSRHVYRIARDYDQLLQFLATTTRLPVRNHHIHHYQSILEWNGCWSIRKLSKTIQNGSKNEDWDRHDEMWYTWGFRGVSRFEMFGLFPLGGRTVQLVVGCHKQAHPPAPAAPSGQ